MPEDLILQNDKGVTHTINLNDLSEDEAKTLFDEIKQQKFKVLPKEPSKYQTNPNPNILERILAPGTKEAIQESGPQTLDIVKRGARRFGEGALGGIAGGPVTAGIGGLMNAMLGQDSETATDSMATIGGGLLGGKASQIIAEAPWLQGLIKQGLGQGAANAGVTMGVGQAKGLADAALDPNRTIDQAQHPELKDAALPFMMGMIPGSVGQYFKNRIGNKSPLVQGSKAFNEMTGENAVPADVIDIMKQVQRGEGKYSPNTLITVRQKELQNQQRIAKEANKENMFKAAESTNANKAGLEATAASTERAKLNPQTTEVESIIKQNQKAKEALQQQLKDNPHYAMTEQGKQIQAQLQQVDGNLMAGQQRLQQIQKQAEDLAAQKLEAQTNKVGSLNEKEQSNINLLRLKQEAVDGRYHSEVTPLIKGSANTEDMTRKLLTSDPPVLKRFMETVGNKDFPDIKNNVIGEVLRQSWDGTTFGNFTKLFGDQGTGGNIASRLEVLLGDKDKAQKTLEFITSMDKGLKMNHFMDSMTNSITKFSAGTVLLSLGKMVGGKSATGVATMAGSELGTMTALQLPKIIDNIIKDKKKYEMWKNWADSGFNKNMIQVGEPLYQSIMDLGDHYKYDENGNVQELKSK